jgi:lipase chaperone LimK
MTTHDIFSTGDDLMNFSKKKIIALSGILILFFLLGYWLYPREKENEYTLAEGYIIDRHHNITLDDITKSRQPLPRQSNEQPDPAGTDNLLTDWKPETSGGVDIRTIFAEGVINSYTTVKYFKHLEQQFKDSANLNEHLEQVRHYLFSEFSESEAQELFETYRKYIECEIALSEEFRSFGLVRTPEEAIALLKRIQDFRRRHMGEELADLLFGVEVKAQEYVFRRAAIVGDKDMYGPDKEELLKKLNTDMWGPEADAVEHYPNEYTRYQEKLKIYDKDLSEISSDDARLEKIREIREEFFAPDVVQRLNEVDLQIDREARREEMYRQKEEALLENPDLTEEQKTVRVRQLQHEMFGEEAEAFRRSETMRMEREKMMKEYEGKGLKTR